MSKLILYLLEASVLLAVLYGLYVVLLRKLTFFSLNRFFLLTILSFSLLVPLLSFDLFSTAKPVFQRPVSELSDLRLTYYQALDDWIMENNRPSAQRTPFLREPNSPEQPTSLFLILTLIVYCIGLTATLSRTVWTLTWMYRLKHNHPKELIDGVWVAKIPYPIAPFSFLNAVFVQEETLQDEAFQQILAHEKTHIDQRHSVDLIYVQLLASLLWFNPLVWQLIKSLKATHEYIVDKQLIKQGYSLVEYQTLLLRQLISNHSYGLVHNFNLSFIKKRITMMKIKESGWAGKARVVAVFTFVLITSLLIVQCNSTIDDQNELVNEPVGSDQTGTISLPVLSQPGDYQIKIDPTNAFTFRIAQDALSIDGNVTEVADIPAVLEQLGVTKQSFIVFEIDKAQRMELVREVQNELRRESNTKILYRARSQENETVELPMLLPPDPNSEAGSKLLTITDEYAKANGISIMKVRVGDNLRTAYLDQVSDFVKTQLKSELPNYVVSVKFEDEDSFGTYFTNLYYVVRGFDELYEERAQELFGKSWSEIYNTDQKAYPSAKAEYDAVRKGIPRAISIAEKD